MFYKRVNDLEMYDFGFYDDVAALFVNGVRKVGISNSSDRIYI